MRFTVTRIRITRYAVQEVTIVAILTAEPDVLEADEHTVLNTYSLHTCICDLRSFFDHGVQVCQVIRFVVHQSAWIGCSDERNGFTEDSTGDTSRLPSHFFVCMTCSRFVVIDRNSELRLICITSDSQTVTTDEDLLSELVQTSCGTHIKGYTQSLLTVGIKSYACFPIFRLLNDDRFIVVSGIVICRDASTDIDTGTIGRQGVDREEPDIRIFGIVGTFTIMG